MNTFVPSGLHFQTSRAIAKKLRDLGFNCVRLNWSVELVLRNPKIHHAAIRAMRNAGVITDDNARALEVMDQVIRDLASEQIMVVLDNHMSDAGWCCDPRDQNGLWFNERWSVEQYESAWVLMASRYKDQLYVIATDLRNEIRPDVRIFGSFLRLFYPRISIKVPSWGTGDRKMSMAQLAPDFVQYTHPDLTDAKHKAVLFVLRQIVSRTPVQIFDWHAVSTRIGNKIIEANPNVMVIVQGLFDLNAYVPNVIQLVFYYMKHDESLYKTIGRHFNIPDSVTDFAQLHNFTGLHQLPVKLAQDNRLLYTVHLYPFFYNGPKYQWNGTSPTYAEYKGQIERFWGFIPEKLNAPVWVGEIGTNHDLGGIGPKWKDYTIRYLKETDLDFAYWPIGDQRPTVNPRTGIFDPGFDEYGLLDHEYKNVKYTPLYDSIKSLLEPRIRRFHDEGSPLVIQQNN